jgi:hypothetical protein
VADILRDNYLILIAIYYALILDIVPDISTLTIHDTKSTRVRHQKYYIFSKSHPKIVVPGHEK